MKKQVTTLQRSAVRQQRTLDTILELRRANATLRRDRNAFAAQPRFCPSQFCRAIGEAYLNFADFMEHARPEAIELLGEALYQHQNGAGGIMPGNYLQAVFAALGAAQNPYSADVQDTINQYYEQQLSPPVSEGKPAKEVA